MKNFRNLLLATLLLTINSSIAQITIKLDSINGDIVNGLEVTHEFQSNSSASNAIHYDFHITNNTGSDHDWMITRKVISQPSGWSNYLCWEGLCYPADPTTEWTSNSGNVPSTETSILSAYINAPTNGTSHLRYYLSSDGVNYLDSVDVVVTSFLSLNQVEKFTFNAFPNPANDNFRIKLAANTNAEFNLYSMTGKLILTRTIKEEENIDVRNLKGGIYIYTVEDLETGEIKKDKLIITK